MPELPGFTHFLVVGIQEPTVPGLARATQDVEFVISGQALRQVPFHQPLNKLDDPWTIRPSVAQIPNEDQTSTLWVPALRVIPKVLEQSLQRIKLSMNVPDNIEGSIE